MASDGEKLEKGLSNAAAIQNTCKFMVAEASKRIFKLEENTWAFYYTETINTNQVCRENMVKSAQHHRLAPGALPHDVLDEILNHTLSVARKMNMVYFVNYASDFFQVEVSHLYDPKTP
jgi:hypothetical protein